MKQVEDTSSRARAQIHSEAVDRAFGNPGARAGNKKEKQCHRPSRHGSKGQKARRKHGRAGDQDRQPPEKIGEDAANEDGQRVTDALGDRKSTRLNSSHVKISYADFSLKKKNMTKYLEMAHK